MCSLYMKEAIKQSLKALKKGDVPIGAVIVYKNKIISKAYNKKENRKNAIFHAEILAIKKACKNLKSWRLDDCVLYTTMEPCMMCCGAIIQSRIKKVVYLLKNDNFGCTSNLKNSKIKIEKEKNDIQMRKIVQRFFENKRRKNNVSRETL